MRLHQLMAIVCGCLACGFGQDAKAQADDPEQRSYLAGRAFREALDARISVTYQNVPLRRALYGLTHESGLALVLDRRIDPSVLVERRSSGRSRRELLEDLAGGHGGELAVVGDVLYIAPASAARRMQTLIRRRERDVAALPPARRRALGRLSTLHWEDLTAPEEILERISEHYELALQGLEHVPWDLWAGAVLPQTTAVEQLSIVLAQFDLTFRWESRGAAARIVPIPSNEREPTISARRSRTRPSRRQRSRGKGGQDVFTGSLENKRLAALLEGLAQQAGCELTVDWEALAQSGIAKDRLVSLTAKRNTFDEVLHKILDPLDVTFERVGKHIYVPARTAVPEPGVELKRRPRAGRM